MTCGAAGRRTTSCNRGSTSSATTRQSLWRSNGLKATESQVTSKAPSPKHTSPACLCTRSPLCIWEPTRRLSRPHVLPHSSVQGYLKTHVRVAWPLLVFRMSVMPRCNADPVLHCGRHAIRLGYLSMVSDTVRTWCRGRRFEPAVAIVSRVRLCCTTIFVPPTT
jgi:hypothetical protein